MAPLPAFSIPEPALKGAVSVVVPNTPSFVGVTLYAQALMLQGPSVALLTNVTADQIVR